ncbi:MAG: hypothetical protein UY92_C0010G0003 [Candidatus Magasanikbacteria bacterium GW2011_GWA2_56_11]|uniref:Uncharacterized protein n=1 Tax=Candidatus Magasanikbacteria bacterium GW2011_GWA2_56_11 TaxID=1619044 RepID=A0A0G2ALB8_9BACT|nr:MAG: hypothetical protein UY92_C0010G0003 [Candidatus Magasanikbacteria bacterium GW2011_GWA2_56_11]
MLIAIPLYVTLFIYLVLLAVFVAFAVVNFYHIITSGTFTLASFSVTFITFALTVLTLYYTFYLAKDVDWQVSLILFNSDWLSEFIPS